MRRLLFGVFAHPDDEAFGPSATLLEEVRDGAELHLICATYGENGLNPDQHEDLAAVRRDEWHAAGKLIGAAHMHALGYTDGTLCNNMYFDIAANIDTIVRDAAGKYPGCSISFMTFDTNGLSGHLDHIAVSNITTYVFYKLKANPPAGCAVRELAYYCLPREHMPAPSTDYVYMPPGRPASYINRTVDVSSLRETKFNIMRTHRTQRKDAETIIARDPTFHNTDHFHVIA